MRDKGRPLGLIQTFPETQRSDAQASMLVDIASSQVTFTLGACSKVAVSYYSCLVQCKAMDLDEFVGCKFGGRAVEELKSIRTGGDNNQKGGLFEDFFAVSKMCAMAARNEDLEDFAISAQEYGFVDDLCVRQLSSATKTNYQAKNSSGNAGRWTGKIAERFERQAAIDRDFHGAAASLQVLVVSCPNVAASNREKIPECAREYFFSEYFPYFETSGQLVLGAPELRKDMEVLCRSVDLSIADSAFRVVLGAWRGERKARKVSDVFRMARKMSKPDLFTGLMPPVGAIPRWLAETCARFDGVNVHVEDGRYAVTCRGLSVSLSAITA